MILASGSIAIGIGRLRKPRRVSLPSPCLGTIFSMLSEKELLSVEGTIFTGECEIRARSTETRSRISNLLERILSIYFPTGGSREPSSVVYLDFIYVPAAKVPGQ